MTEYVISVSDINLPSHKIYEIRDKIEESCKYSSRTFEFLIPPFAYGEEGAYVTSFKVRVIDAQWLAREAYKAIVDYNIPKEIILTNAGANNAFLCIGTDAVVDKGIILYAYSNLSLSKKASRQKITAICDSAETATITIQEI